MQRIHALITFLLLAPALAGCASTTGGASDEGDGKIPSDAGRLFGQVVDDELRGLSNATVFLPDLGFQAPTDTKGAFEFQAVPPGLVQLQAYQLGFQPAAKEVEIRVGESTAVTLILHPLPANGSYFESFPYIGFEACQWYFEGTIAHCTFPYTAVHGTLRRNGVNLTQYGVPPDVQTNHDRYNFTVRLDHAGVVSELFWRAGSAAAAYQMLVIMCPWYDPLWDECVPPGTTTTGVRYFTKVGTNPLRIEWKHPNKEHHKLTPWVMSRANVNGDDTHPVGISFDQRIEMYNTVFYGSDPPPNFSGGPPDG